MLENILYFFNSNSDMVSSKALTITNWWFDFRARYILAKPVKSVAYWIKHFLNDINVHLVNGLSGDILKVLSHKFPPVRVITWVQTSITGVRNICHPTHNNVYYLICNVGEYLDEQWMDSWEDLWTNGGWIWKIFLINGGWIFDNERSDQREQVGN